MILTILIRLTHNFCISPNYFFNLGLKVFQNRCSQIRGLTVKEVFFCFENCQKSSNCASEFMKDSNQLRTWTIAGSKLIQSICNEFNLFKFRFCVRKFLHIKVPYLHDLHELKNRSMSQTGQSKNAFCLISFLRSNKFSLMAIRKNGCNYNCNQGAHRLNPSRCCLRIEFATNLAKINKALHKSSRSFASDQSIGVV